MGSMLYQPVPQLASIIYKSQCTQVGGLQYFIHPFENIPEMNSYIFMASSKNYKLLRTFQKWIACLKKKKIISHWGTEERVAMPYKYFQVQDNPHRTWPTNNYNCSQCKQTLSHWLSLELQLRKQTIWTVTYTSWTVLIYSYIDIVQLLTILHTKKI